MPQHNLINLKEYLSLQESQDPWDQTQLTQNSQGSQFGTAEIQPRPLSRGVPVRLPSSSSDYWSQSSSAPATEERDAAGWSSRYSTRLAAPCADRPNVSAAPRRSSTFQEFDEMQSRQAFWREQRDLMDTYIKLLKEFSLEVRESLKEHQKAVSEDNCSWLSTMNQKLSADRDLHKNDSEILKQESALALSKIQEVLHYIEPIHSGNAVVKSSLTSLDNRLSACVLELRSSKQEWQASMERFSNKLDSIDVTFQQSLQYLMETLRSLPSIHVNSTPVTGLVWGSRQEGDKGIKQELTVEALGCGPDLARKRNLARPKQNSSAHTIPVESKLEPSSSLETAGGLPEDDDIFLVRSDFSSSDSEPELLQSTGGSSCSAMDRLVPNYTSITSVKARGCSDSTTRRSHARLPWNTNSAPDSRRLLSKHSSITSNTTLRTEVKTQCASAPSKQDVKAKRMLLTKFNLQDLEAIVPKRGKQWVPSRRP